MSTTPTTCANCGASVHESDRFCGSCGLPVGDASSSTAGAPTPPPAPPAAQPYGYVPPTPVYAPPIYAQPTKTNGFAIASMVLGIVWVYWVGSLLALIFGLVATNQIKQSQGRQTGEGMAIAGIVLGIIGLAILLLLIIIGASVRGN